MAPGQRQGRDAAFQARREESVQQGDQVAGVFAPLGLPPGRQVDLLFDTPLMKVAEWKTVEGKGHQAHLGQPRRPFFQSSLLPQTMGRGSRQPQPQTHRGMGAEEPLHAESMTFQIGSGLSQVSAGVDVSAVTQVDVERSLLLDFQYLKEKIVIDRSLP